MLPLRAPVHTMSSYGLGHCCSDPNDVNQLRWVPDEGEAVSELDIVCIHPRSSGSFAVSKPPRASALPCVDLLNASAWD